MQRSDQVFHQSSTLHEGAYESCSLSGEVNGFSSGNHKVYTIFNETLDEIKAHEVANINGFANYQVGNQEYTIKIEKEKKVSTSSEDGNVIASPVNRQPEHDQDQEIPKIKMAEDSQDQKVPKIKRGPRQLTKSGIPYRTWYKAKEERWVIKFFDGGRWDESRYRQG